MHSNSITVEAVFEDGVFRPTHPLTLQSHQRVTLIIQLPGTGESMSEPTEEMMLSQPGDYFEQLRDYEERLARGEIQWQ